MGRLPPVHYKACPTNYSELEEGRSAYRIFRILDQVGGSNDQVEMTTNGPNKRARW